MIYIGIPVRNERHTIGPLLWRVREVLYGERREFHVIVCDDASDDGTTEALQKYPRVLPMTLLRNDAGLGYAASLERLIREAVRRSGYPKRDALVTMQADFSDAPEWVPEMMRRFDGGADLVTVRLDGRPSRPERRVRFGARLLARGLRPFGVPADPFASLRLYRLFALGRALTELEADAPLIRHEGWAANAEILLRVWPHLRRAEEIEVQPRAARRYRDSRFQASAQIRALRAAGRDPQLRATRRAIESAARA